MSALNARGIKWPQLTCFLYRANIWIVKSFGKVYEKNKFWSLTELSVFIVSSKCHHPGKRSNLPWVWTLLQGCQIVWGGVKIEFVGITIYMIWGPHFNHWGPLCVILPFEIDIHYQCPSLNHRGPLSVILLFEIAIHYWGPNSFTVVSW